MKITKIFRENARKNLDGHILDNFSCNHWASSLSFFKNLITIKQQKFIEETIQYLEIVSSDQYNHRRE